MVDYQDLIFVKRILMYMCICVYACLVGKLTAKKSTKQPHSSAALLINVNTARSIYNRSVARKFSGQCLQKIGPF